jgi:hypothetical protein
MKLLNIPRSLFSIIVVLLAAIFLVGSLRAFDSVHASFAASTATAVIQVEDNTRPALAPGSTPIPAPVLASADTSGVIVLSVLIVIIVAVGAFLGTRRPRKKSA